MKEQLKKILLILFLFYLGNISNSHADKVLQCFDGKMIYKLENKIAYTRTESGWERMGKNGKTNDGVWSNKGLVIDFEFNRATYNYEGRIMRSTCAVLR